MSVFGWDIGGSNTKICLISDGRVVETRTHPFEVRLAPERLPSLLRDAAARVGVARAHAVTMTAELSRCFLTKREGVAFVLDAVELAFPGAPVHVFTVDGSFVAPSEARRNPLTVAAANWMAAGRLAARTCRDAVFVDVGTTTTDIVPIVDGAVVPEGRTDPDRLASGELLYTGAVRTPVEALSPDALVLGRRYALAAEAFATSGDVYLWRGDLVEADYAGVTADGRPATREFAGHRLARALCSDRGLMDDAAVTALASALAEAQLARIAEAIARVAARHPSIRTAVIAGRGAFIAARAARLAGLDVLALADVSSEAASRCAPATAVALLLDEMLSGSAGVVVPEARRPDLFGRAAVDVVLKVGGGLLAHPEALSRVLAVVPCARGRVLVVPGGGPFAETVRDAYGRGEIDDETAHWMAILAMDQYAELLRSRVDGGVRVETLDEARAAAARGAVPILAPSRWLREADPLPHSWDVTSDSIAAWVAGEAGAREVILVKPPGATGTLTDPYFEQALPREVRCEIVTADDLARLCVAVGLQADRHAHRAG
jgi:(4-(4-[2-(gamma-L-glutamylamino)ethyl]phenoxymethyl)furan-2-yl)methanamine synthase